VLEDGVNVAVYLGRYAVNFYAVARGNQDNFGKVAGKFKLAAHATKAGHVDGEFFAQLYWRGLIAQACDKDLHTFVSSVVDQGLR
jgi:hypothetical protein